MLDSRRANFACSGHGMTTRIGPTEDPTMSQVYNPEVEVMAEIERLELEARDTRRRVERARDAEDKRVLNRLLKEVEDQIRYLRTRLP